MNQRVNGEGPIYRRSDGRWTAACYVLRPDGTRVRRAVYGKTRKEVADQLAVLIAKTKGGPASRRGVVDCPTPRGALAQAQRRSPSASPQHARAIERRCACMSFRRSVVSTFAR
jgi:hypothetical protein